ncbi:uncharacterized protein PG998_004523 [Apiospora kogelbergensis]|uniref:uncharacterized protein n=1 Tax=Apiospora kogelbergensis TaxID=1337665 RepID=UPI0031312467
MHIGSCDRQRNPSQHPEASQQEEQEEQGENAARAQDPRTTAFPPRQVCLLACHELLERVPPTAAAHEDVRRLRLELVDQVLPDIYELALALRGIGLGW